MRIMASLMRSAAVPCKGVFTAVRSAKRSRVGIAAVHVGDGALASRQRQRGAGLADFGDGVLNESLDARVQLEVGADVFLRLLAIDSEIGGQAERRLSVHDPEVDGFGVAAHLGGHHQRRNSKHFGGGARVNVLAIAKRGHQNRIARHVRQQPQLDLRIIGDDQLPALARDKRRANLAAQFGADRDVLQIRIRGRQAGRWRRRPD